MRVYRIRSDGNRYQYFLSEREEDWEKLEMDCVPQIETWSPPPVFIYKPKLRQGDFYNFGSGILITSPRATEALRTHLEMAGELLPLPHADQTYTLLNVLECINCLDQERTEWVYGQTTGARIGIKKYVFHPDRFSESRLFKIPETSKSEILVVEWNEESEDEFRNAVEAAQLKGLLFEQLWEG